MHPCIAILSVSVKINAIVGINIGAETILHDLRPYPSFSAFPTMPGSRHPAPIVVFVPVMAFKIQAFRLHISFPPMIFTSPVTSMRAGFSKLG
jgi:hypothetical protein